MKEKVIPITSLRDTGALDELVNSSNEPIFVTKNGYDDFVIVPKNVYKNDQGIVKSHSTNNLNMCRIMCTSIELTVGNIKANSIKIKEKIKKAVEEKASYLLFQRCALCGVTAVNTLKWEENKRVIEEEILEIAKFTKGLKQVVILGTLFDSNDDLAFVLSDGKILSVCGNTERTISINGVIVEVKKNIVLQNTLNSREKLSVILGLDNLVSNGSNIYLILGDEKNQIGSNNEATCGLKAFSKFHHCICAISNPNMTESTNDFVYGGLVGCYEDGNDLQTVHSDEFKDILCDIDLDVCQVERNQKYHANPIYFSLENPEILNCLRRRVKTAPFLPFGDNIDQDFVQNTISIQAKSLVSRLKKIRTEKVVIGLSGGLDSALALIVCYEAFKLMGISSSNIYTFSLPCFGTTSRTKSNSQKLAELLGTTFQEIDIGPSVDLHLKTLKVDEQNKSVAFENAQARERTQVLMDFANLIGGLVVGTGDMSELALGWCTYNGDHMAMYSLNAGLFKTTIRYVVKGYAETHNRVKNVLEDILNTPISPELLPSNNDQMSQWTENIIGPYELQDFYIYHFLKYGYSTQKLYKFAKLAFKSQYTDGELKKWLKVFYKRFFAAQFKRNTMPDGVQIMDIGLSSRGKVNIPSDYDCSLFIKSVEELK